MALYRATQARAFLAGRDFALPDDVKALVPAVLGHRVLLDIDRELRGSTVDGVIEAVVESRACAAGPGPGCAERDLSDAPRGACCPRRHRGGALLGAGGLVFAGVLMRLIVGLRSVWSRYGLHPSCTSGACPPAGCRGASGSIST